jgi:hypothetical protein
MKIKLVAAGLGLAVLFAGAADVVAHHDARWFGLTDTSIGGLNEERAQLVKEVDGLRAGDMAFQPGVASELLAAKLFRIAQIKAEIASKRVYHCPSVATNDDCTIPGKGV